MNIYGEMVDFVHLIEDTRLDIFSIPIRERSEKETEYRDSDPHLTHFRFGVGKRQPDVELFSYRVGKWKNLNLSVWKASTFESLPIF